MLIVSHGAYLSTLVSLLPHPPFSFVVDKGVDLHRHCLNTSVMRVEVQRESGGDKGQGSGRWRGRILSWGEVDHLDGLWEKDLGVADDVRA